MQHFKKKTIWGLFIVFLAFLLIISYFFFVSNYNKKHNLIGQGIILRRVMIQGNKTEHAYAAIPYNADSQEYSMINIAIDLNQDGKIEPYMTDGKKQPEWVVQNISPRINKKLGNNFSFVLYDKNVENRTDLPLKIILTKHEINKWEGKRLSNADYKETTVAMLEHDEVRPRFSPDPTGVRSGGLPSNFSLIDSTQSKGEDIPVRPPKNYTTKVKETGGSKLDKVKILVGGPIGIEGIGKNIKKESNPIKPDTEQIDVFNYPVPDLLQRPNECVPTSVANSLIWLANKYNFKDKLPKTPRELIDELKTDFKSDAFGVDVPKNFLNGKSAIIKRRHLPLETHQVGETFDLQIVNKIAEELRKGQDVEIDLEYGLWGEHDAYTRKGGHMVTAVGVRRYKDKMYLEVHDPLSPGPRNLDIYKVIGTRVVNYRYEGSTDTYIRFAIAESPMLTPEAQKTATDTPPETPIAPKEEPTTPGAGSRGEAINLGLEPNSLSFKHQIGSTVCPTPIGKTYLTINGPANWKIVSTLPKWLGADTNTGNGSGDVSFVFTCQLDKYTSQELYTEISFQLFDADNKTIGSTKKVIIQGQISQ